MSRFIGSMLALTALSSAALGQVKLPAIDSGLLLAGRDVICLSVRLADERQPRFAVSRGDAPPSKANRELTTIAALRARLDKDFLTPNVRETVVMRADEDLDAGIVRDLLKELAGRARKVGGVYIAVVERQSDPNNRVQEKVVETPQMSDKAVNGAVVVTLSRRAGKSVVEVKGKEIAFDDLTARLRELARTPEQRRLVLECAATVRHGDVVRVQDAAKTAGMTEVSVRLP